MIPFFQFTNIPRFPRGLKCKMLLRTVSPDGLRQNPYPRCPDRQFVRRLGILIGLPSPLLLGCLLPRPVISAWPSGACLRSAVSGPGSRGTGDAAPRPPPVGRSHSEHDTPPCSQSLPHSLPFYSPAPPPPFPHPARKDSVMIPKFRVQQRKRGHERLLDPFVDRNQTPLALQWTMPFEYDSL